MSAAETKAWLSAYSEWTEPNLDYGDNTLNDVWDDAVAEYPDKPATWFFGREMTYGELDKLVRRAAAGLRAFGVRPGDKVALAMPNCPQHVVAFYAVLKLGATVTEHNPLYTAHELHDPFVNSGARVAVVWDKAAPVFEKLRDSGDTALETIVSVNVIQAMPKIKQLALRIPLPALREARDQLHGAAPNTVPFDALVGTAIGGDGEDLETVQVTPDTPAVIMYTSGTTGAPKGAQLSHGNLFSNIAMGKAWVKDLGKQQEYLLAALPFFHAYGLTTVLTLGPHVGGQMVIVPSPKMDLIADAFKAKPITWMSGVPLIFERVMETADEKNFSLKSIRNSFCGAANMPKELVDKWEGRTSGMFVEGYGLTETSPILIGTPMNDKRKAGYIGVPFPDTEIRIVDLDNLDELVPDGQEGEILARGPQVMAGYLNNEEANEKTFHDGWFRTGDVGVMDSDGFVKLVARIKEVIITGGFNVYPVEVEEVLAEHPDIEAAAVVGKPRPDGSEDVVACVTLREGAAIDIEGMKAFARERLTPYKVPRTFYHFEELPANMMGKVSRKEVREQLVERIQNGA